MKKNKKKKTDDIDISFISTDRSLKKYIKNVWNLELNTSAGKINWHCCVLLVLFTLGLTVKEWIVKIIAIVISGVKTFILHENIVEEYETTNTILLISSLVIFMIICIVILLVWDKNVRKINELDEDQ